MAEQLTPAEFAKLRSLPPEDAVRWMQARTGVTVTHNWQDLFHEEHSEQFTISRLTRLDLLQSIRDGIERSVKGDLSRRDWQRDTQKLLSDAGWWGKKAVLDPNANEVVFTTFDPARLKLIYDTNTRQAYAAGQWQRIERSKRTHPYLRYVSKRDERVRLMHASWDNVTLPVDDPFWQTHYPPNGWRCRCRVVSVSQREYDDGHTPTGATMNKQRPEVVSVEFVNKRTGEVSQVPAGIDPGFGFNPGMARARVLRALVANKLQAAAPDLAAMAAEQGLELKPRQRLAGQHSSISPWTHPGTGTVRCYFNTLAGQGNAKVWAEQVGMDPSGSDYVIRVKSQMHGRGEAGNLANEAEQFLTDLAGRRINTFAEILRLLGMA